MYSRAGHQAWTPPPNFAMVEAGVYRSAYPTLASVPYLKHIGIKTVVLLSIELLPASVARALASTETTTRATGNSEGNPTFKRETSTTDSICVVCTADLTEWMNEYSWTKGDFAESDVRHALNFAFETDFQPVLFTCPTGDIQTSVVIGCMRRYQGWTLAAVLAECELFVNVSTCVRPSVMSFIERWDVHEHPLREAAIASWKRELLLQESQQEHFQRRNFRGLMYGSIDSGNDDVITSNDKKTGGEGGVENYPTHNGDNVAERGSSHARKGGEGAAVSSSASAVTVALPPWYTAGLARRTAYAEEILAARAKALSSSEDRMAEPHERYFGVRNPPALDERSTFTKESVVEEDDD
ncbi:hypothetical protein TCSYLVIO_004199 [Trypanosoma cruzi]|uniref:Tyrosine phosphatase n=2 Tax=Trypanosoma cruzi TaxID=5693 RepID=V5BL64_TRYCR|nr:hypothetical protein TCSYLVIO_004199 [Trypanosoma cruzi]ESS66897.1 hypothetical protein TCDM_04421 [Trypanosoma cruzi Dm28c]PBJ70491.1 hypothetical protein BCY84_18412 [Trypanosoma cruzi cruzi]KAF8279843.1 putative atypical dual specificity phosphatase [Trypanosoma cruzi]PWU96973.1 hypothetical protein C4B63_17g91 [Trypanosoma cruzi]